MLVKEAREVRKIEGKVIYRKKPYVILSEEDMVLWAGSLKEFLNDSLITGYYNNCIIEPRTTDLYLNDNTKIKESSKPENINRHWKVNVHGLFKEILSNSNMTVMNVPLQIFQDILAQVASRAIILNDAKLNQLMLKLSLYEISNPESSDFDPDFVSKYLDKEV